MIWHKDVHKISSYAVDLALARDSQTERRCWVVSSSRYPSSAADLALARDRKGVERG